MEQVGDVVMASNSHNQIMMIRGKRTKRPRTSSPLSLTIACSSSSSVGEIIGRVLPDGATISPTTSTTGITESPESSCFLPEEEDMANCLILLAQGSTTFQKPNTSGLYVYRCMTCDKSFSSFQALGGHTASHKKPKPENTTTEERKARWQFAGDKSKTDEEDRYLSFSSKPTNTTLSLKMITNNNRVPYSNNSKVYECAICGAEFSSGQALGGHMRRHRTFTSTSSTIPKMMSATAGLGNNNIKSLITEEAQKKYNPRNGLCVDLNLPAPEESHPRESSSKKFLLLTPNNNDQSSILCTSTPPLVDCPY